MFRRRSQRRKYALGSRIQAVFDRVYERHIEETISDEQIRRVLEPVLARIRAGEFGPYRFERKEALKELMEAAKTHYIVIVGDTSDGMNMVK